MLVLELHNVKGSTLLNKECEKTKEKKGAKSKDQGCAVCLNYLIDAVGKATGVSGHERDGRVFKDCPSFVNRAFDRYTLP